MTREEDADTKVISDEFREGERIMRDSEGIRTFARIRWKRDKNSVMVWVRYYEENRDLYWSIESRLSPRSPEAFFPFSSNGTEGKLTLKIADGSTELHGDLPLSTDHWFQGPIARWPREDDMPEDDIPKSAMTTSKVATSKVTPSKVTPSKVTPSKVATPKVATPKVTPCPPDAWRRGGTIIENPDQPSELFRFLWVRAVDEAAESLFPLAFVVLKDPEILPLYVELNTLRLETDGRGLMMAAAGVFAEGETYVDQISDLGTPISAYPTLIDNLLKIEDVVEMEEVLAVANTFLFAFGVGPLEDYLVNPYLSSAEDRVWPTLFAVTLGAYENPHLGDGLVDVLRVNHLLRELERELDATSQPLTTPEGRRAALTAHVVLPEGAVPLAPGCSCDPPPYEDGWVRALGVGDLKLVFQCLLGYQIGEIADVVNVLPRERLELSSRELSQTEAENIDQHAVVEESQKNEGRESGSDLRHEVGDLITAEALCSTYNNLTQEYDPPNITLSGTWSGNDCLKERADRETRDYAQSLTRRAASRLVDEVTQTRTRRRFEEQEWLSSRDVDNRQGTERLVGIYRWLKKVYRLSLGEAGKRLIVELEIAKPARAYLRHIRHEHGIVLVPPPHLGHEGIKSPENITAENYLRLGQLYHLENLKPPPPEKRVQVINLQSQPPVDDSELAVPVGYQITDAEVAFLLSDASANLAGYVGKASFEYSPPSGEDDTESLALPSAAPLAQASDGCTPCDDPFTYTPPLTVPVQDHVSLTELIGESDTTLPAAVVSSAASFFASVTLTSELTPAAGLFEAWQVETYSALVKGFDQCRSIYLERLRKRIEASSSGRERQIERRELKHSSIAILASLSAAGPPPPCSPPRDDSEYRLATFFEQAFDWREMTYSFSPYPSLEQPCGRDPLWPGQAVIDLQSDELFKSFLHACSARVLVPVRPGQELQVLHYLLFGLLWPGDEGHIPVAQSDVALVADLAREEEDAEPEVWCLEIPTSLLILQEDDQLPAFECQLIER